MFTSERTDVTLVPSPVTIASTLACRWYQPAVRALLRTNVAKFPPPRLLAQTITAIFGDVAMSRALESTNIAKGPSPLVRANANTKFEVGRSTVVALNFTVAQESECQVILEGQKPVIFEILQANSSVDSRAANFYPKRNMLLPIKVRNNNSTKGWL